MPFSGKDEGSRTNTCPRSGLASTNPCSSSRSWTASRKAWRPCGSWGRKCAEPIEQDAIMTSICSFPEKGKLNDGKCRQTGETLEGTPARADCRPDEPEKRG